MPRIAVTRFVTVEVVANWRDNCGEGDEWEVVRDYATGSRSIAGQGQFQSQIKVLRARVKL